MGNESRISKCLHRGGIRGLGTDSPGAGIHQMGSLNAQGKWAALLEIPGASRRDWHETLK